MEALEELRKQLDEIDDQLVKLYEDRMRICALVGKYKIKNGRKVIIAKGNERNYRMWKVKFLWNIIKKEFGNSINS